MVIKLYRVDPSLTGNFVVGGVTATAGKIIKLPKHIADRAVTKYMLDSGLLVDAGEMDDSQVQCYSTVLAQYMDGRTPEITGSRQIEQNWTIPVMVADWDTRSFGDDKARAYPEADCVVESIEFTSLTTTELSTQYWQLPSEVNIVNSKTGVATPLMTAGPTKQPVKNCMVGVRGGLLVDYTTAANAAGGDTVDAGLAAANSEFIYIGYHDVFDGLALDVDTANDVATTALRVQYQQATDSGTVQWTTITAVDGTDSGGVTLAQDGTLFWYRPNDWIPSTLYSGYGEWYYVRISNADAADALKAETDLNQIFVVTRKWRPYGDVNPFIEKGDYVRIDATTTAAAGQTSGVVAINLNLRRVQ